MDYTIRDTPDPPIIFSNEDYKKLVKTKPSTLEQALAQREILITLYDHLVDTQNSLVDKYDKVYVLFYGQEWWFDQEPKEGALDLLTEMQEDHEIPLHFKHRIESIIKPNV